jgi:hypothetical protein
MLPGTNVQVSSRLTGEMIDGKILLLHETCLPKSLLQELGGLGLIFG